MKKLTNKKGQTTVEYLLIIAVIVVVIATLGKGMQSQVDALTKQIFGNISKTVNNLMQKATSP